MRRPEPRAPGAHPRRPLGDDRPGPMAEAPHALAAVPRGDERSDPAVPDPGARTAAVDDGRVVAANATSPRDRTSPAASRTARVISYPPNAAAPPLTPGLSAHAHASPDAARVSISPPPPACAHATHRVPGSSRSTNRAGRPPPGCCRCFPENPSIESSPNKKRRSNTRAPFEATTARLVPSPARLSASIRAAPGTRKTSDGAVPHVAATPPSECVSLRREPRGAAQTRRAPRLTDVYAQLPRRVHHPRAR